MKKMMLALATIVVLGGSSFALVGSTGAQDAPAAECGPCDPSDCGPCAGCPCE